MNKNKIAIAIVAVMTAASVTKAEDTTLNFDGHGQTKSFAAMLAGTPAVEVPTVAQAPSIGANDAQDKVCSVPATRGRKTGSNSHLIEAALAASIPS